MKTLSLLIAGLFFWAGTSAAKTVNIEYILDASGSMLEVMDGEMKIDIAKRTLTDLLERMPEGASEAKLNVGLRVYGHSAADARPDSRCRDTVLEVPVAGIEVGAIKEKISAVRARGWTPIAYSLRQAGDDFPEGDGNENIIILISDGKETCEGAPCAVARQLHEAGIAVKIHVVGFDIKPDEKAQLECIATAAGGKYFSADSARGLNAALTQAQDQVLKQESSSVRIKVSGPGKLSLERAKWVAGDPYLYQIISADDGKMIAQGGKTGEAITIPAGTYRLLWDQWEHNSGEVDLGERFEIKPGQTTTLKLNTGINLVPAKWLEEPPYYWCLKDKNTGKKVLEVSSTWAPVLAPAGTYELWYRQWQHGSSEVCLDRVVKIKKGAVTEVAVNTGVTIVPSDPNAGEPYNWLLSSVETAETVVSVSYKWGPVPVPPGTYSLSLRQTEHGHSLVELIPEFTVNSGQLVEIGM